MNEKIWKAIIHCDRSYDGKFFYGVDTTSIFCRPSCKSKNPKRENVRVFTTIHEALSAGFRPCKRCSPDKILLPDEDLIHRAMELMNNQFQEPLTLANLSDTLHISPYHLLRTFKRIVGHSPAQFLRNIRLQKTKEHLTATNETITDIAIANGFPNAAHFSTVFQKKFGIAPSVYRSNDQTVSLEENNTIQETENVYWDELQKGGWNIYIAVTNKGLCCVTLPNESFDVLIQFVSKHLPNAILKRNENALESYKTELEQYLNGTRTHFSVPLDMRGTIFQISVWESLLSIPYGEFVSYSDIANQIGNPSAVRAVGRAIGSNPIPFIIPCHRVIGKNRTLTGYRGGLDVKSALLHLEGMRLSED